MKASIDCRPWQWYSHLLGSVLDLSVHLDIKLFNNFPITFEPLSICLLNNWCSSFVKALELKLKVYCLRWYTKAKWHKLVQLSKYMWIQLYVVEDLYIINCFSVTPWLQLSFFSPQISTWLESPNRTGLRWAPRGLSHPSTGETCFSYFGVSGGYSFPDLLFLLYPLPLLSVKYVFMILSGRLGS